MDQLLCMKCSGTMAGEGQALPAWRGTVMYLPFPTCPTCCWAFIKLLDTNEAAVKFLNEGNSAAALAYSDVGGSA
jgi:hypothetical protein